MLAPAVHDHCSDPHLNNALTEFCFGELDPVVRDAVARHILECDVCWRQVQPLEAAVGALRTNPALKPVPVSPAAASSISLSGRVGEPFGGHGWFVSAISLLYAALYVASLGTELVYSFDRFRHLALLLSPPVFIWTLALMLVSMSRLTTLMRQGRSAGIAMSAAVFLGGIGGLVLLLAVFLPAEPTIQATFSTRSAFAGYLKNVGLYFVPLALAYVLWPFHVVIGLQREVAAGRWANVLKLLNGSTDAFWPVGVWFVRPRALTIMLIPAAGVAIFGASHLLDNLVPGPYASLFTTVLYVRILLWFTVAALGLGWYVRSLNDLKRETLLAQRLDA